MRGQYFLRTIGSFLIQTGGEVQAQRCACLGLIIWREPAGSAADFFPYQACDASLHLVPNKPVVLSMIAQTPEAVFTNPSQECPFDAKVQISFNFPVVVDRPWKLHHRG